MLGGCGLLLFFLPQGPDLAAGPHQGMKRGSVCDHPETAKGCPCGSNALVCARSRDVVAWPSGPSATSLALF